MNKAVVAISSDFLDSFSVLPRQTQGKVTEFINKFRNDPESNGINYEKINNAMDGNICSVRIDKAYRGIVARQKKSGVYLLLWVDHHDDAYAWAKRKRCEINPTTGSVQVFDVIETNQENMEKEAGIFEVISNENLIKLAVPEEQLQLVKSITSLEMLYSLKKSIPEDAYEALEWLANDIPLEEVLELFCDQNEENVSKSEDDYVKALDTGRSRKSFVVPEGEGELKMILAEPLEKWRVFLHPSQRKIVNKDYSGPARVLGGAGTGKTVVAMHRAKMLASKMEKGEKLLFTTFTANLANDIKDNLRKICTPEEQRKIEVINLDAWCMKYMREHDFTYRVAYGEKLEELWEIAVSMSDASYPVSFYQEEWSKVVCSQEAFTKQLYFRASRLGRGTRLNRKKRMEVWKVFEEYQLLANERGLKDIDTAMYECKTIMDNKKSSVLYKSIVVDEAQDLGMNAFRLLRAIAGEQHENDIFIVGDTHQRIYKKRTVLSHCDVNIRGRSRYLRINYRTTEETRKFAFALLEGLDFDDLDNAYDKKIKCQSLLHGEYPEVNHFADAGKELEYVVEKAKSFIENGTDPRSICIVARTHKLLDDYIRGLNENDIKTYEIKRSKADDRTFSGVRVATMHRVKGLEFKYVFLVAVNKNIVPLKQAIDRTDRVSERESMTAEKCLLYVSLTRAQKAAYVSSYGKRSELIK